MVGSERESFTGRVVRLRDEKQFREEIESKILDETFMMPRVHS